MISRKVLKLDNVTIVKAWDNSDTSHATFDNYQIVVRHDGLYYGISTNDIGSVWSVSDGERQLINKWDNAGQRVDLTSLPSNLTRMIDNYFKEDN